MPKATVVGICCGILIELFIIYQMFTHAHWSVAGVCSMYIIEMRIKNIAENMRKYS